MTDSPEKHTEKEKPSLQNVEISGRFDQYRSSYWAAMLAAFGLRYLPKMAFRVPEGKSPTFGNKHIYSAVSGAMFEAVTAFFAFSTYKDMRNIFAESLSWEMHKPKEDVGFFDFLRSKNTVVQQTVSNYLWYNGKRLAVNSLFFLPYVAKGLANTKLFAPLFNLLKPGSKLHPENWHWETGAEIGLTANAVNLLGDVLNRRMTPFEALQAAIDRKINHADHASDKWTAEDLFDIYERHAANGKIGSFLAHRGTPQWDASMAIFERMAELMNETYGNVHSTNDSDFGIPKFIYLVGHNLIQPNNPEQTLAYIELANAYGNEGIPNLQKVLEQVKQGTDLNTALQAYPLALPAVETVAEPEKAPRRFSDSMQKTLIHPTAKPAMADPCSLGERNFVERLGDKMQSPAAAMNMPA